MPGKGNGGSGDRIASQVGLQQERLMVEVVWLDVDADPPERGDDEPWVFVEESSDGLFFGSGSAWKPTGEWVGYASLSEDDADLDRAVKAACAWAERYNVPTVHVFASR